MISDTNGDNMISDTMGDNMMISDTNLHTVLTFPTLSSSSSRSNSEKRDRPNGILNSSQNHKVTFATNTADPIISNSNTNTSSNNTSTTTSNTSTSKLSNLLWRSVNVNINDKNGLNNSPKSSDKSNNQNQSTSASHSPINSMRNSGLRTPTKGSSDRISILVTSPSKDNILSFK